jgi:hypothetical protein
MSQASGMDANDGSENAMLSGLHSRLTYANVMATVAVFLALGGGAYALSGIPDRGGVFHGCVSNRTGVLRVAKSASSCQKAKARGKHKTPGESAITWNQKGQLGANGKDGTNGTNGKDGSNGLNGTNGTNGTNGATNTVVRAHNGATAGDGLDSSAQAACNPGEHATGGGFNVDATAAYLVVNSYPDSNHTWNADIHNTDMGNSNTVAITTFVVCASP